MKIDTLIIVRPISRIPQQEWKRITKVYKKTFKDQLFVIVIFQENETDKTTFEIIKL